jgi:hypothetical protein
MMYLLELSERLYEMQNLLSFIARHCESVSVTSYVLPDSEPHLLAFQLPTQSLSSINYLL